MTDVVNDHLKYWSKGPPSDVAIRVAKLLHVWDGLHHFDSHEMSQVDWVNPLYIKMRFGGTLSTFDFNQLTRLVFLAHDHCIRIELRPSSNRYFHLLFHLRHSREGGMTERHPTLEQAVAQWRAAHPITEEQPLAASA